MSLRASVNKEVPHLLRLGLPLVGSHLAQFSIQITDTLMLGWYGVPELAASVLAGSLLFTLILLGSGFAQAVMPMVASAASQNDDRQVRRITRMAIWLSTIYFIPVVVLFNWSEPFLVSIGQEPHIARMAGQYLAIAGFGMLPFLIVMVLKSYLAALESTNAVLWLTIATAVLNAILNYILIFGHFGAPELGLVGAAIASLVATLISAALVIAYAVYKFPEHTLFSRFWRPDFSAMRENFSVGWPIGLTLLAESGLFAAAAVLMGWVSETALAAHGIAIQLAALAFMVHLGLANAVTIRVGRAHGKADLIGIQSASWAVVAVASAFAVVTIVVFVTLPEQLLGLFLSPDDPARPAVLLVGVPLMYVAALFQFADSGQVIALGMLRGLHDTRAPMFLAAVGYWLIGAPAGYILGIQAGYGGAGVWFGLVLGLTFAWVTMLYRYVRVLRRYPRQAP